MPPADPILHCHPAATRLPFSHQGPFVTIGDGGVLCIDEAYEGFGAQEGKPLFSPQASPKRR